MYLFFESHYRHGGSSKLAIKSEPRGSKPFLPGLVKIDMFHQVNPSWTTAWHCILHARWSDSVNHSVTDLTALASNTVGDWVAQMIPHLSALSTFQSATVQSLGGDGLSAFALSGAVGGVSGVVYPPNVALAITWKAGITWRGGRPRSYLGGIPQSYSATQGQPQITSTAATAVNAGAGGFLSAFNAHTYSGVGIALGVPSYFTKGAFRPVPLFFPFLSTFVHERLDSQRRRLGKEAVYGGV